MQPAASTSDQLSLRAIIEAARERARRRRLLYRLAAGIAVGLAAFALALGNHDSGNSGDRFVAPEAAAAGAVLRNKPYMGLSCTSVDARTCHQIGFFAQLRDPADSVTVVLMGHSFALDDLVPPPRSAGRQRNFEGYLDLAGIRNHRLGHVLHARPDDGKWSVAPAEARFPVELTIHRADGSVQTTKTKLWLAAGWG